MVYDILIFRKDGFKNKLVGKKKIENNSNVRKDDIYILRYYKVAKDYRMLRMPEYLVLKNDRSIVSLLVN
jgi:hypothetical protein